MRSEGFDLTPPSEAQLASLAAELSDEELRRRYDPTRMTALDVYPDIWTRGPGEAAFDYLLDAFNELRDFVSATSARGDSMIVSIV